MNTHRKITTIACTLTALGATIDGITTLVTGGGFPFWQTTTVLLAVATVIECRRTTSPEETGRA